MKPSKVLLYLSIVLLMLGLTAYFFPENGLQLSKDITLQFPKLKDILSPEKKDYADITSIIQENQKADSTASESEDLSKFSDTASYASLDKEHIQQIEYPGNDKSLLYPFFEKLQNAATTSEVFRIMHYGDSQIEGDRITSYLRFKFQSQFGGFGIGMFPVVSVTPSSSLYWSASDNWMKVAINDNLKSSKRQHYFGPMMSFARLVHVQKDSLHPDTTGIINGWIKVNVLPKTFAKNQQFKKVRMFTSKSGQVSRFKLITNGKVVDSEIEELASGVLMIEWKFAETPRNFTIRFSGKTSPDVYGLSLEGDEGIAVDNVPLRGSSGYGFNWNNAEFLREFYKKLNVKLLFAQFGVNAVPQDEKVVVPNYAFYERAFYQNLRFLKSLDPDLSIIVIGISDRSRKNGESYETNPNVLKIRLAQRNAAFRAGCMYWDMFEAMGGENSMPSWVMAKPPLANKDFTHFNDKGARFIGEMFYKAIMKDFMEYQAVKKAVPALADR